MARYTNKLTLTLWVSVVYVLSFICYVPTLLEQNGIIIPNILLYVKYLYVCIPSIAAGLRAECQGVLFTDVFRENNSQTYFDMGCMYGCGDILFLLLFAYNGSERKYLFVISITIGKLYISADYSTC